MRIKLALLSLTMIAAAPAEAPVMTATGVARQVEMMQGRISFALFETGERFSLDAKHVPSTDELLQALDDSDKTGKSVTVHLYIDSGRFENGAPTFAVRDVEYGGKTIKGEASPPPAKAGGKAAADLAKGVALFAAEDFAGARAALDAAVMNSALGADLRPVALKTRADLNHLDAFSNHPPGADRDKLLRAALVDDMAWQALAPDSGNARAAAANAKAALGGYDDALAEFQAMLDKWPRAKMTTYMQIEAIEVTRGNYDKALAALDEAAKAAGAPPQGMAYHYHRGWVLSALGRDDEAISEFTVGLKAQPDYVWAHVKRACSYGKTGDVAQAAADQEAAVKLLEQGGAATTEDEKFNRAHAASVLAQLHAIKDPHAKTDAACGGYWSGEGVKRERSTLLPPEGAPPKR
ncbi:MAG TPA: tetratricopeptide repeat protein [Rhizomicrobium sp.]|nr:tetratricopeptide repeat protein [Rhizomicrobium sp.]